MATYNFTIRAIDNLGAYADQTFSMTVNNTNLERWMVVGSTGLAHSPDGSNWTIESGQSGGKVVYGNGKWVVYSGPSNYGTYNSAALGLNLRTSVDGFNWTTAPSGIPSSYTGTMPIRQGNTASFSIGIAKIDSLKFMNGIWTAIVGSNSASGDAGFTQTGAIFEYTSPDLVTWTLKSSTFMIANGGFNTFIYDHYIDTNGLSIITANIGTNYQIGTTAAGSTTYTGGSAIMYRGSAATTYTPAPQVSGITSLTPGAINSINGLYCASLGTNGTVYTSIDGIGWTARTAGTQAPAGIAYANGRLVARGVASGAAAGTVTYSLNGGRTWSSTTPLTYSATVANYGTASTQALAYYGGKLILLEGQSATCGISTSTDSGSTWTSSSTAIGSAIGVGYGIAVRV